MPPRDQPPEERLPESGGGGSSRTGPDAENAPRRQRWLAWAIGLAATAMALGMLNVAWRILAGPPGAGEPSFTAAGGYEQAPGAGSAALPSPPPSARSCMRCHGIERSRVGPSFVRIAERYRSRAGAQAYLAGRIVHGGVGEWGRVVMPRQIGVSGTAAQELAAWILQLAPDAQRGGHPAPTTDASDAAPS